MVEMADGLLDNVRLFKNTRRGFYLREIPVCKYPVSLSCECNDHFTPNEAHFPSANPSRRPFEAEPVSTIQAPSQGHCHAALVTPVSGISVTIAIQFNLEITRI